MLVADDQVVVERKGAVLSASPPEIIKGKLEIRGLGIVDLPFRESVVLRLAIGLEESGQIERLPDLEQAGFSLMGISLPHVLVDPGSSSAAARVRAAAFHVSGIK